MQKGDLSFWDDKGEQQKFLYFMVNQYCRTKRMRDKLLQGLKEKIESLHKIGLVNDESQTNWEGIAQVICDFMEVDLIHYNYDDKVPILLNNLTPTPFITSDQPIINLSANYDGGNIPDDFIPYFPINHTMALVVAASENLPNSEPSESEVAYYNNSIFSASHEQIFANEEDVLRRIIDNCSTIGYSAVLGTAIR